LIQLFMYTKWTKTGQDFRSPSTTPSMLYSLRIDFPFSKRDMFSCEARDDPSSPVSLRHIFMTAS